MGVARVRCCECRGYFGKDEAYKVLALSKVCSEECWSAFLDRRRHGNKKASTPARAKKKPCLDIRVRRLIRQRDGVCRYCGMRGEQIHHVLYRSQGGSDHPSNLILLCESCHRLVHSNKRLYQPLLLGTIWKHYWDGQYMTVPQFASWFGARCDISGAA